MTPIATAAPATGWQARNHTIAITGWIVLAIVLVVLPLVFPGRSAISTFSYLGIMAIFALSYNVLLGQAGLLSLGHGMFFGFGGFITVLVFQLCEESGVNFPLPLLPLFGAVGASLFGILFGWIAAGRGGMTFAMITLGLGELVHAASFILPSFFGGEEGKGIDRTMTGSLFGFDFATQIEIYYVIVGWFFISAVLLFLVTKTPFGLLANAVRENAERVEFVGFKPSRIRFLSFVIAAFFGGIAGGLAALNFEVMTTSDIGAAQSTLVLLMTYIGGIQNFFGPVIGAITIGIMKIWLSDITPAWQLYFGILFIFVVMFVPEGLVGILTAARRYFSSPMRFALAPATLLVGLTGLATAIGLSLMIELGYRSGLDAAKGPVLSFFGLAFDVQSALSSTLGATLLIGGFLATRLALSRLEDRRHNLTTQLQTGGAA
ncbi:branched-chain amino acid ABC transporter permease [Rhizobium alvei]|uniref:Branched-chain amino acid ABC transporter permease n=1 Tax=Rhizobium alvei TaxID=1132659 RepID=A0ABT8YR00_9HYPH|nr:branched-chain amino acid ABC transporter permease [Rhizobium alvei]MDO6966163.1 branched-chain amino acid ABC transporter permease [Rhizobium alvei]